MVDAQERKGNGLSLLKIAIIITVVSNVVFLRNNFLFQNDSIVQTSNDNIGNNNDNNADFDLAQKESLDFFDDIPSAHWKLYKERIKWQAPNFNTWYLPLFDEKTGQQRAMLGPRRPDNRNRKFGHFFQNHFEPEFTCQHERRIGAVGDGGKWICDPHRITNQADKKCLVYSIGSNNDFSFESSVQRDIGEHCEIHTFDPGNYQEKANKTKVNYHQYMVGLDSVGSKSIATIVKELGHEGRTIDVFKIDCEKCEWVTAKHWFEANITLRQIQVELHQTKNIQAMTRFFDFMWQNHYVITQKEPNIAYPGAIEYAFLKLAPEFFEGINRQNASMPDSFYEKFPDAK